VSAPPASPPFAAAFPREPALDALVAAFARGDFGRVRRDAPGLIAGASAPEVRAAATELLARTRPDPAAAALFAMAAALLVGLSAYWWVRAGAGP